MKIMSLTLVTRPQDIFMSWSYKSRVTASECEEEADILTCVCSGRVKSGGDDDDPVVRHLWTDTDYWLLDLSS